MNIVTICYRSGKAQYMPLFMEKRIGMENSRFTCGSVRYCCREVRAVIMKGGLTLKKLIIAFVITLVVATTAITSADAVSVRVGSTEVKKDDVIFDNSTTYVPLRTVSNLLCPEATVSWSDGQAIINAPLVSITSRPGDLFIQANGRCLYAVDGVKLLGSRTFVPVRTLAKAFGASVTWDSASQKAIVTKGSGTISSGDQYYNSDDVYWLSRIINAESSGESMLTVDRSPEMQRLLTDALAGKRCEALLKLGGASFEANASPVLTNGETRGVCILVFDVTEKAALEAQRREFSANVSHDFLRLRAHKAAAVPHRPHPRSRARRQGPQDVKVSRQRHRPAGDHRQIRLRRPALQPHHGKQPRQRHGEFDCHNNQTFLSGGRKKPPSENKFQRAETINFRGTTSVYRSLTKAASSGTANAIPQRCNGRSRCGLLAEAAFSARLAGCILLRFLQPPCTDRRLSDGRTRAYLFPVTAFDTAYCSDLKHACQMEFAAF